MLITYQQYQRGSRREQQHKKNIEALHPYYLPN